MKTTDKKRAILAKELDKLLPEIDAEGLAFLVRQAHTLVYNQNVDKLNRDMARLDALERPSPLSANAEDEPEAETGAWVEDAPGGTSFVVVLGNTRKTFSRVELQRLVALAKAGAGDPGARLYDWFKKHRGDVLFDARLGSPTHPALKSLAHFLRTHYKLKNG